MSQHWKIYESMPVSKDSTTTKQIVSNVSEINKSEISIIPIHNYLVSDTNNDNNILETSSIIKNINYIPRQDGRPPLRKIPEVNGSMNEHPRAQNQVMQKLNTIIENKIKNIDKDESYQFLMSLLPYLRNVPKHRKLTIRHKLQKVFIDEEERTHLANLVTNSTRRISIPTRPPPPYPKTRLNFTMPLTHSSTYLHAEQSNVDYSNSNLNYFNNNNANNLTETTAQTGTWTY